MERACRRIWGKQQSFIKKRPTSGYAEAQYNLGLLYENGEGVPKDLGKAAELYQKAADQRKCCRAE